MGGIVYFGIMASSKNLSPSFTSSTLSYLSHCVRKQRYKKKVERIFFAADLKSTLEGEAINYMNIQINKAIRFNLKWQSKLLNMGTVDFLILTSFFKVDRND